uniref:BZIP domain-containing protein n=1 Tax=Neogobius melanostomus TaxID=47308 RepID=A0A8C6SC23_9GOBI
MAVTGEETETGTPTDLSACHLRNPGTSSSQGGTGITGLSAFSSKQPTTDSIHKREIRLLKNREAARECRRKKKEYVRCLENRVAILEKQNKTLIDELRAMKEMYRHE